MQAANDVEFRRPLIGGGNGLFDNRIHIHLVGARLVLLPAKGAELAAVLADIGVIDVAVGDVVCLIAVFPFANNVCNVADMMDIVRPEKPHAVVKGQPFALFCLFKDIVER